MTHPLLCRRYSALPCRLVVVLSMGCGGAKEDLGYEGETDAPALLAFDSCGAEAECATLTVPIDPEDEGVGFIALPVRRFPAVDPGRRVGTVVVIWGGPGSPSAEYLEGGGADALVAGGNSGDLRERFDLVAVNWRGTGESEPALGCLDDELVEAANEQPYVPVAAGEWATMMAWVAEFQGGCLSGSGEALLARMGTVAAVGDLELLRAGLGEDKITVLAWSYGTRLGLAYAQRHPDRVRTMALDSVVAPVPDWRAETLGGAAAAEDSLDGFFEWCAGDPASCPFAAGDDAAALAARWDGMVAGLVDEPLPVGGRLLRPGDPSVAALVSLYAPPYQWNELGVALESWGEGDGAAVLALADAGARLSMEVDNFYAAYASILAADTPADVDADAFVDFALGDALGVAPRMGGVFASGGMYRVEWPVEPAYRLPPVGASSAPPMLLIAGAHDPVTPWADSELSLAALANGSSLLTYQGYGHASSTFVPCVEELLVDWMLEPGILAASTCPPLQP